MLILSDLHLGEGRDPKTGFVSRQEDFFFDDEFCAFLDHHSGEEWSEMEWTLVINGDFFDFLQVVASPPPELSLRFDATFGPKAGPLESAWKAKRIIRGHSEVFRSLAQFVLRHRLILVAGNHDAEFHYPEVQETFLSEMERHIPPSKRETLRRNIEFRPWFYLSDGIYVEHGHQYDPLNSFQYQLAPRLPDLGLPASEAEDLDLPLGSLFVRYLFNRVETESPFADNIKPATRFLKWFALNHPLRSAHFLMTDGPAMLRRIKSRWRWLPEVAYATRKQIHSEWIQEECQKSEATSSLLSVENLQALHELRVQPFLRSRNSLRSAIIRAALGPVRTPLLAAFFLCVVLLLSLAGFLPLILLFTPVSEESVRRSIAIFPFFADLILLLRWIFLFVLLIGLMLWLLPRRKRTLQPQLREKATRIQQLLKPRLVVLGHSHEVDLARLNSESEYFNTGTWTKVFSEEPRIIREEKELTFLRALLSSDGWKAKLMKWEGTQKCARLAYLFSEEKAVSKEFTKA